MPSHPFTSYYFLRSLTLLLYLHFVVTTHLFTSSPPYEVLPIATLPFRLYEMPKCSSEQVERKDILERYNKLACLKNHAAILQSGNLKFIISIPSRSIPLRSLSQLQVPDSSLATVRVRNYCPIMDRLRDRL